LCGAWAFDDSNSTGIELTDAPHFTFNASIESDFTLIN
jgi:hypothetical protein